MAPASLAQDLIHPKELNDGNLSLERVVNFTKLAE